MIPGLPPPSTTGAVRTSAEFVCPVSHCSFTSTRPFLAKHLRDHHPHESLSPSQRSALALSRCYRCGLLWTDKGLSRHLRSCNPPTPPSLPGHHSIPLSRYVVPLIIGSLVRAGAGSQVPVDNMTRETELSKLFDQWDVWCSSMHKHLALSSPPNVSSVLGELRHASRGGSFYLPPARQEEILDSWAVRDSFSYLAFSAAVVTHARSPPSPSPASTYVPSPAPPGSSSSTAAPHPPPSPPASRFHFPSAAELASHPRLYTFLPRSAHAKWQALARPFFLRYIAASRSGDPDLRDRALLDILMLPQRSLVRRRGGSKGRYVRQLNRTLDAAIAELNRSESLAAPSLVVSHSRRVPSADGPPLPPLEVPVAAEHGVDVSRPSVLRAQLPSTSSSSPSFPADDSFLSFQPLAALPTPPNDRLSSRSFAALQSVVARHPAKAAQKLLSLGAHPSTLATAQALQDLHPPGPSHLPSCPTNVPLILIEDDRLNDAVSKCANGSGPGASGWTGDLMKALVSDPPILESLKVLVGDLVNVCHGPLISGLLRLSLLSGLRKPGSSKPRPVANGEYFTKLAGTYVLLHVGKTALAGAFDSIQLAWQSGGSELAIHLAQSWLDTSRQPSLLISADASNAFNSRDRAQILECLFEVPSLQSLFPFASWLYGVPSKLLFRLSSGAFHSITSSNGVRQGCTLGSLLYALSVQRHYVASVSGLPVRASAIIDDFNIFGLVSSRLMTTTRYLSPRPTQG